jgi:Uma2 family endonuclease
MIASIPTEAEDATLWSDLLRPARMRDGADPEERVIHCGISWRRYLALDRALGENRPSPRLYYLDGDVEIMTTSNEHERIKKSIGGFLEDYFLTKQIEVVPPVDS